MSETSGASRERVLQQRRALCGGTPLGVLGSLVLAGAWVWGLGDTLIRGAAMIWLAVMAAVLLARLLVWYRCRNSIAGVEHADSARWLFRFRVGLLASGALWGVAGLFFLPEAPASGQAFLGFVILGVCASGLSWLPADRAGFYMLIFPALLGLAGGFGRVGGNFAVLMILAIALFAAFLLFNADRINRQFRLIHRQAFRLDDDREQILRLSRVASQTTNGVIITDPGGKAVWTNPGFTRMLGYSDEQIIGRLPFRVLVGRATNPAIVDRLMQSVRNGEADEQELQLKTRSGEFIWVRAQVSPVRDEQGDLINYMGILVDISDEKEASIALDQYQQALQLLIDLAADQSLDGDARLNRALELGYRVLGMDSAMIVRSHGRKLEVEFVQCAGESEPKPGARSMLVGTLAETVLEAGETIRITDVPHSERGPRCLLDGIQCRSYAGHPVELSDRSVHVISISAKQPRTKQFSNREKVFLELLFQWIFSVMEQRARSVELNKLVEQVPGMVYQFRMLPDGATSFPFTSSGIREIYGIGPEEAKHDLGHVWEVIHSDDVGSIRESIDESARTLNVWEQQYRVIDPDGSVRWLHGIARPEALPDGSVLWHGYIKDISERKHAEFALKASEQRLRALFELTPLGIVLNDIQTGAFIETNGRFQALSGFSAEQLRQKQFIDLCPDDYLERHRSKVVELLHADDPEPCEGPMLRADGNTFIARMHSAVLEDAAGNGLIWTLIEDVTEQRHTEQAFRRLNDELEECVEAQTREVRRESIRTALIVDVARDGFIMHDEEGHIHRVNPALCAMLGLESGELIGKSIPDIAPDTEPQQLRRGIEKVRQDGSAIFETRFARADGMEIDLEVSVGCGECEEQTWFYAFLRDISERKRAEQALQRAKREAEQASTAKTEFLSRMSHELRTPLNAILGFSQLLKSDPAFPEQSEQHDSLSEISDAGRHLLNLVDEVLDLSRIEQGQLDVRIESVRIMPLVQECLSLMKPIAGDREISMHLEVESNLAVRADRTHLKEVVLNLLSNAIKYNKPKGSVSIKSGETASGGIVIEIVDTGRGIADEQMDRLFQPFERLGDALDGIEGTGIGLALAKKLTELMDGEIGVESVAGEGSRFWIELPDSGRTRVNNGAGKQDGETAVQVLDETEPVRRSLLYIEDNPSNMRLVRRALATRPELRLLEAVDGEAGLELARNEHPDLILLDLNLPGRDGLSILREMRADADLSAIPVIAVTANATASDREMGLEAGLDGYVTKPISIPEFIQTIDQVLERISIKA